MEGYTIFFSYILESDSGSTSGYGYTTPIHCNYVNNLYVSDITNKEVNIYFNDITDFKFLSTGDTEGSGYTVTKISLLVQLIDNSTFSNQNEIKPVSNQWRKYDVTNQIIENFTGFTVGQTITPLQLTSSVFKVPIYKYYDINEMPIYDLDYLKYPKTTELNSNLCFGEEEYFLGNVSSDVEAIAYTTDIVINLPIGQFNSSNNLTWDGVSDVYITEIGIFDNNNNLVAIGKLNNPLPKNSTISRTIVFGIDF
jgi:hypothetical protein